MKPFRKRKERWIRSERQIEATCIPQKQNIPMTYTFPEAKVGLVETLCAIQIPHVQVKVVDIHSPSRLSAIYQLLPPLECLDDCQRILLERPVPIHAYPQISA